MHWTLINHKPSEDSCCSINGVSLNGIISTIISVDNVSKHIIFLGMVQTCTIATSSAASVLKTAVAIVASLQFRIT